MDNGHVRWLQTLPLVQLDTDQTLTIIFTKSHQDIELLQSRK